MIFRAVFAKNYANQLIREGNLFNERIALVLFLIYLAVISLFVYLAIPMFEPELSYVPEKLLYPAIIMFFLEVLVGISLSLKTKNSNSDPFLTLASDV